MSTRIQSSNSPAVLVVGKSVERTKKGRDRDAVVVAAGKKFLLSSDVGTARSFSVFASSKEKNQFKVAKKGAYL